MYIGYVTDPAKAVMLIHNLKIHFISPVYIATLNNYACLLPPG